MYTTLLFAGRDGSFEEADGNQLTEDDIANRVLGTRSNCILARTQTWSKAA